MQSNRLVVAASYRPRPSFSGYATSRHAESLHSKNWKAEGTKGVWSILSNTLYSLWLVF